MSRAIHHITFSALGLLTLLVGVGCFEATDENYALPHSRYVAMGNSLTAGFQSGGLGGESQLESYPAVLAKALGITEFEQPLIASPGIGSTSDSLKNPQGPLVFDLASGGLKYSQLTREQILNPASMLTRSTLPRPYNNLGVPGATAQDVLTASTATTSQSFLLAKQLNPYFDMILRGGSLMNGASMLTQAIAQQPDIITLEIGNNDILSGVTSGTVIVGKTVTPPAAYQFIMTTIIDSLLHATSAQIYIGNIPSIATIPYVTAVPTVIFNPKTFTPVIDSATDSPIPWLTEESNVEAVLFPALTSILAGDGIPTALGGKGTLLPGSSTLTAEELATADSVVDAYNAILASLAAAHSNRITLVDIHELLTKINAQGGYHDLNSGHPLLQWITKTPLKSAFSLDGIHPNSSGYQEVADLFLAAIKKNTNQN